MRLNSSSQVLCKFSSNFKTQFQNSQNCFLLGKKEQIWIKVTDRTELFD